MKTRSLTPKMTGMKFEASMILITRPSKPLLACKEIQEFHSSPGHGASATSAGRVQLTFNKRYLTMQVRRV